MSGKTVSDELVPSTISNSSLIYARNRKIENPASRAMIPSTTTTNKKLDR